jgi:ATP/maltotriose-dependent transcriptional regulator MalT
MALISAPAGFGQTTLLAQTDHNCAWLLLDACDNDLPRLLRYLAAALQTVEKAYANEACSPQFGKY